MIDTLKRHQPRNEVTNMKLPLQISFHNLDRSSEIEDAIHERAARLDEFADRIMSCRVVVDVPHKHHQNGNLYQVRIDITLPGGEIAVNRESGRHKPHEDIHVAIRDAFAAAVREVEDYVRVQRAAVKTHEPQAHARVARIFPQQDYGFLRTSDDREVYFHRHSLVEGNFDHLEQEAEVTFVEEQGDKGPQASTVRLVGRHAGI
jgi:cold shock CspA family protein/ribosome-associated translation inhibitor RaiA